jgi:iron complex outermembrane recepter protein
VKQKYWRIVFSLLTVLSFNEVGSQADAAEKPTTVAPATTVKQWRSQLTPTITEIRTQKTPQGIEIRVITSDNRMLQGIKSVRGNNLIIDFPNTQLNPRLSQGIPDSSEGISKLQVTTLRNQTVRIIVSGVTGTPTGEVLTSDRGAIIRIVSPPVAEIPTIDIIVTAEKKTERLQDVPISITSIDERAAEDADITTFRDIAENTPNFTTYTPSRNFVNYSVRGFSNFNFISRDSVAFYIDDVPYDYTNFLGVEIFDIQRVEVLRGAQATLYGRNAQAGVVNIITKPPARELEFDGAIAYGNYDNFDIQASVSSPIVRDKLAFRLSGSYESRDGYTENTFLDTDIDSQSGFTTRGKLLWTPNEDVSVAFNASIDDYNDGAQPFVALDAEDPFTIERDFNGFTNLNTNTQSVRVDYQHEAFRFTSISARRFSSSDFKTDVDIFSPPTDNLAIQVFDVDSDSLSQEIRFQSPEAENELQWLLGSYLELRDFEVNDSSFITDAGITLTTAEIDENTLAFFAQASYQPIEAVTLTGGLRYESFDSNLSNQTISDFTGLERVVTSFDDIERDDILSYPVL